MNKKLPSRVAQFGSELIKGNIGNAFKSLSAPRGTEINPYTYSGRGGMFHWMTGGRTVHFSWNGNQSAVEAHRKCSPLTAIVNRKTQAFANGKTYILDEKGKVAETAVAKKLRVLMAKPNPLQTWKQLEALVYHFKQVFGYCVVLTIKPVGFSNLDAKSVWVLPPQFCDIEERTDINLLTATRLNDFIKSISFTAGGRTTTLDLDTVFIFRDVTPNMESLVLPESRVRANEQIISNIIGAYESRGVLIDKRGPTYVVSSGNKDADGSQPLSPVEKDALDKDFSRYGLMKDQVTAIISTAALQVATVGFDVKQLGLFEEIEDDIMRLCDSWNYPYALMASNRTNQLGGNNIGESNKKLYQDAILPEAEDLAAEWTLFFGLEKLGLRFDKDYTHVPELQDDRQNAATARKTLNEALKMEFDANLITLDGWLEKLGEDPLPDGKGNLYASELKKSDLPLAMMLTVGAFDGLVLILTAQGMSAEARQASLEILFRLSPEEAARMATNTLPPPANPNTPAL